MRKKPAEDLFFYKERSERGIPPKAPPPGRDKNLGKQCVRSIAERIVGTIEYDERKGHVIKGSGKRTIPVSKIPSILDMHEGFKIELTIYEDHDPDGRFRIAEALEGWKGTFTGTYSESIYVERIRQELQRHIPSIEYRVRLKSETIHVDRLVEGREEPRYELASEDLGWWELKQRAGKTWESLGDDYSFLEALQELLGREQEELNGGSK